MVKIVKPGKKKVHDPIYFKCKYCGCIFTADEDDCDENFDPAHNEGYWSIDCPCCEVKIYKQNE